MRSDRVSVFLSIGVWLFGCVLRGAPVARKGAHLRRRCTDTTKGDCSDGSGPGVDCLCRFMLRSVMSGVITGPYFKAYCQFLPGRPTLPADNLLTRARRPCPQSTRPPRPSWGTWSPSSRLEPSVRDPPSRPCPPPLTLSPPRPPLAVTSLLAAPLADRKGRRFTLLVGAVFFSIGGAIQTFTMGYEMMLVGRIISGSGVGMMSCVLAVGAGSRAEGAEAHVLMQDGGAHLPVGDLAGGSCGSADRA